MVPTCVCELGLFDYFIRIGNFSILVYFLFYFVENKFLVWLRKDDDWVVIDRQMLDTMFDNRDLTKEEKEALEAKAEAEEVLEEGVAEVEEAATEVEAEAAAEAEAQAMVESETETEKVVEEAAEAVETGREQEPQTPPSQEDIEVKAGVETGVDNDDQQLSMSEVLFGQKENN